MRIGIAPVLISTELIYQVKNSFVLQLYKTIEKIFRNMVETKIIQMSIYS